jgi:hypothetical protein
MDQGATNSGGSPESFISHRDLTASVHDHEPTELEMFVFLILCPTLPSAPSLAVFPAAASQSLARFVRWCFTTWPTSWWLQQKWSTYLTIHRRPPMPPHRNTRPLAHLRHLQPKRQSAVPKPPGVLSEPPNQPLARQRKPPPASRSLPAPTASLR